MIWLKGIVGMSDSQQYPDKFGPIKNDENIHDVSFKNLGFPQWFLYVTLISDL